VKTTWISQKDIERKWYLVDATDLVLGRLATQVASLLIGKSKVHRVPNMDCGDYVIFIHAEKVVVTGKKQTEKKYYRHSGYPGGFREESFDDLLTRKPTEIVRSAVKNMLPNTKLRSTMLARLSVNIGPDHSHAGQKPEKVEIRSKKTI